MFATTVGLLKPYSASWDWFGASLKESRRFAPGPLSNRRMPFSRPASTSPTEGSVNFQSSLPGSRYTLVVLLLYFSSMLMMSVISYWYTKGRGAEGGLGLFSTLL